MAQNQLVLVTGVSGYLGSHIVDQLVKAGHRVRGTVRSSKVAANKQAFSIYGDAVEIFALDDLASGVFPEAFKGVDAVIHSAAPLATTVSAQEAIRASVDGSLNVFRQAEKAGVRRFSYASSMAAVSSGFGMGDYTKVTADNWAEVTMEQVLAEGAHPGVVYVGQKVLSERAVWEFAAEHPHIELLTVNPPYFYGPFAPAYKAYEGNSKTSDPIFSTMVFLYGLINAEDKAHVPNPFFVDVRDVARALVAGALDSPPTSQFGKKRILLSAEWVQPSEILALVRKERPALAGRLTDNFKDLPAEFKPVVDNARLKEVLGFGVTPWQKTILDGLDDLLRVEEVWKKQGLEPQNS
ncbi:hypothetical protein EIP91_004801 [Steccherinum ochraceum]|uniref:NAD-dependent epimerase/dehydratase domain-containing protein n=1 Tax=Steccherinum ochraceum TaxID=92696 RepID=A0A4R0R8U0_9APHY|nr:hypothetical protein EIP91_004801 [Steccherinum ochraceum]